jgi:hypothetical protein
MIILTVKKSGTVIGIVFDCVDGNWKAALGKRIRIAHTAFFSLRSRAVSRSKPDRPIVPPVLLIVSGPLADVRGDELTGKLSNMSKSFEPEDALENSTAAV